MNQAVVSTANNRYLVYTSAGDVSAVPLWLQGHRNFDLWVTYYGTKAQHRWDGADYWVQRRAGKFQNLRADWRTSPEIFNQYDAIMVMDDDIVIDATDISRLFELRDEYALTVLQPAFLRLGRISHRVTRHRARYKLRYTQFIEVTCPLFRRDALETFLQQYDGGLTGWGIDHWFMDVLSREPDFRAAVIDTVPCINPHDDIKGGAREISMLQADNERRADWERLQAQLGISKADTRHDCGRVRSSVFQFFITRPRCIWRRRKQLRWLQQHLLTRPH